MCSFLFALLFYTLTNPHGYLTMPVAATEMGGRFLSVHDAKWIIITLCIAVNTGANLFGIGASKPAAVASKAVSSASSSSASAPQPKAVASAESTASAPVRPAKETPKLVDDEDEDADADAPVAVSKAAKRTSSGRKAK